MTLTMIDTMRGVEVKGGSILEVRTKTQVSHAWHKWIYNSLHLSKGDTFQDPQWSLKLPIIPNPVFFPICTNQTDKQHSSSTISPCTGPIMIRRKNSR